MIITLNNIVKEFKVLNRREGLKGSIKDLFSRDYKIVKAVDDISLEIEAGEILGYIGPNGAGKSTTIKMMTGVLKPTSGEILVNGRVPYENRTKNAQNIGVVFGQRTQLWWALPLIESFKILKDMYQVNDKDYQEMIALYESLVDLKKLYSKPVRQMSLGQRTLSDILASFLHNPSVVFLDEPTIGLDVSMKSKIRELITALNKEKNTTVILTTHDMGDIDALCKRTIIIDKGKKLYDDSTGNLKSLFGSYRTLKLTFFEAKEHELENIATDINLKLHEKFENMEIQATHNEEWIDVLMKEDETSTMEVLNFIQKQYKINDIKLEDISTENVVKKIYEREKIIK